MWFLIIAIVLLGLITAIVSIYQQRRLKKKLERGEITEIPEEKNEVIEEECCGQHSTCEKDSLLAAVSKEIDYYDDEELDTWKHTSGDAYTPEAIDEFREVFYTLKEDEVAGWVRSLQLREIELPDALKEEVLLVIRERRMPH